MKPLISVIIPVYNGEKFVLQCVESVQKQTLENLQIIIVDDGSTDCTFEILKKMKSEDSRIEIIHQDNGGVSKARNQGLNVAKGDWILFVDSDDSIIPNYCEYMLKAALKLQVDVLIAHPKIEGREEVYYLQCPDNLIKACLSNDEISFPFNIDSPWGKLFRYSVINEYHICFPEELTRSEDAFFCLQFYAVAGSIGALNQFGYVHAEREGSICHSFAPDAPETLEKVLRANQQWVMTHHPGEDSYLNALWFRVLPGIVECERTFFLHSNFSGVLGAEYQKLLRQPMVRQAIYNLKLSAVLIKQYKLRLLFYKLHLGWLFIMIKRGNK